MNYVHQIIDSEKLTSVMNMPKSLQGQKVEIIILPVRKEPSLKN
jgi:hypothetical protein